MTIYVHLHEIRNAYGKVKGAVPDVRVEVSPNEGYDLVRVTAFERDLGKFIRDRVLEALEKVEGGAE